MTRLPPKRQRERSGIIRARRHFSKHQAFVRRHRCVVPGCENDNIEFAHLRSAANAGMGLKPADWFGVSLCGCFIADGRMREGHHAEAHRIGHDTFAAKYGIDLWALAREFARSSPDFRMRETMKESLQGETI